MGFLRGSSRIITFPAKIEWSKKASHKYVKDYKWKIRMTKLILYEHYKNYKRKIGKK